jgi:electron transfer flavoprotein alpha subunit
MLRVVVVFEFEGITDPDSAMSDVITNVITKDCEEMGGNYGATACWVDDVYVGEKDDVGEDGEAISPSMYR